MEGIIYEEEDGVVSEKDDFYSSNLIEESIDSDEISAIEEGFMQGYMNS